MKWTNEFLFWYEMIVLQAIKISNTMSAYFIIDHESFGIVFVNVVGNTMSTVHSKIFIR